MHDWTVQKSLHNPYLNSTIASYNRREHAEQAAMEKNNNENIKLLISWLSNNYGKDKEYTYNIWLERKNQI